MEETELPVPLEVHVQELLRMCLNNFMHDHSITLMLQTFEGFNHFCTKAHGMDIHLNKSKRGSRRVEGPDTPT